jgi:NAD(P)H dehydrogenase (quinone)
VTPMPGPIAITGASGGLGGRVAAQLAGRAQLRLIVRDSAKAPQLPDAEVAVADYREPATVTAALRGVETVLLVSAGESPERLDLHRDVVAAIKQAGVRRVVYTSFLGASPTASFPFARDHAHTERAIRNARLELTALRNSLYADFVPLLVGDDDVIRGPAADGTVACVSRADIARLAAAVLLDDSHAGFVYDVTGPIAIDLAETALQLSELIGRRITYHPETLEEALRSRAGAQTWLVEGWVGTYLAIATGELAVVSHTIEHVTGTPPMSLGEFLRAEPDAWANLRR